MPSAQQAINLLSEPDAHFRLHRGRIGSGVTDDVFYRSRLSNTEEMEANRFAADLLMPWALLAELTSYGIRSVDELARAFKVSEKAMRIRLGDVAGG